MATQPALKRWHKGERVIHLTPAEIQSNSSRVKWAEGLILQLPDTHDGRNSWLINYGHGEEAAELRLKWAERHPHSAHMVANLPAPTHAPAAQVQA